MTSLPSKDNIRDIILEMKDEFISRDAIEKLQSLQPTSEEVNNIRNAHQRNLEIPLGTAEQFLLGTKYKKIEFLLEYFSALQYFKS